MKKRIWVSLIIVVMIFIITIMGLYKKVNNPFKVQGNYIVDVEEGETFYTALNKLENKNLIFNTNFVKLYVKFKKLDLTTKPGKYIITKDTTLENFITMLNKGNKANIIKITIPEGYNIVQIGELLEKKGLLSKKEFIDACAKYPLPKYVKVDPSIKYPLEGYLFPSTYEFKKSDNANAIINSMIKEFEKVLLDVQKENNLEVNNLQSLVTVASLIEKEARIDEDRQKIASVIYNRLKKDMKLQIDATVLYALGYHKDIVTIKDTQIKSPYNTYYIKKLPVGPICSVGKKSLIAALKPDNTDYLFYLYKKDSTKAHYFTNNYEDFKKAMKKYGYN